MLPQFIGQKLKLKDEFTLWKNDITHAKLFFIIHIFLEYFKDSVYVADEDLGSTYVSPLSSP